MAQRLDIEGMSCDGCEAAVVEALSDVPGVTGADADHETDTATVEGDAEGPALISAVEEAGYSATLSV